MATDTSTRASILQLDGLVKDFVSRTGALGLKRQRIQAVAGIDLTLLEGETLGIVGESGCGKSTMARLAVGLDRPTSGQVRFQGRDLATVRGAEARAVRRAVQLVFQDPYASLNPRMTAGELISEGWEIHDGLVPAERRRAATLELMEQVGLDPSHADRFPHQFSGGQRQRIGIARAIALRPRVLVCDEPVSALDVSVQAQILNLLRGLRRDLSLSCVLISHDLNVVRSLCDRVAVMYLGRIVEIGDCAEVFARPRHPYTRALLSAAPTFAAERRTQRIILSGDVPSPARPPSGCRFRTRCWKAVDRCAQQVPELSGAPDHRAACHFPEDVPEGVPEDGHAHQEPADGRGFGLIDGGTGTESSDKEDR